MSEWVGKSVSVYVRQTSAYPLFLPRQDSRSIDDTDALQDRVRHLGTHEPVYERGESVEDTEGRKGQ